MADGTLTFDTKIDATGFDKGVDALGTNIGAGFKSVATGIQKGFNAAAVAVGAVTTATVAAGKAAIDAGKDFDTAVSQIAATMGTSVDKIQDLRNFALEMGSTTAFSATEAAEGLNILAMAGLNAKDQIKVLPDVLNLSAAGAMDLSTSAAYVTGAIKGFGDEMENSSYYANMVAKGATLAATDVNGLGLALSTSAATAHSYGQSADSVTLSLLRLAEQNITGSEAATALNRAMMDLYTPTSNASKQLTALGVSAYDSSGKAKDFNVVVDELAKSVSGMSDEQKNAALNTIFTTYGLQAFNKMIVSSNDKVNEFKKGISEASDGLGAAATQAKEQLNNLEGDLTLFNSAMEGLKIRISDELTNPLRELVSVGTNVADAMRNTLQETGSIPKMIEAGSKAIADFLKSINKAKIIEFVTELSASITSGLSEVVPLLVDLGATIVTAIVNGISKNVNNGKLFEAARSITSTMVNFFVNNIDDFIKIGIEILGGIGQGILDNIDKIIACIPKIIEALSSGLSSNPQALITLGLMFVQGMLPGLLGSLAKSLFNGAASSLLQFLGNGLLSALSSILPMLASLGMSIITALTSAISAALPVLVAIAPFLIGGLIAAFAVYFFGFTETGQKIVHAIGDGIMAAIDWIGEKVKQFMGIVIDFWKMYFSPFIDIGKFLIEGFSEGWSTAWDNLVTRVKERFTKWIDSIKEFFGIHSPSTLFKEIGDFLIQGLLNGIIETWNKLIETVTGFFKNLVEMVKQFSSNIIDTERKMISNLVNMVSNMISTIVSAVTNFVSTIANAISSFVSNVVSMVTGFVNNVSSMISNFVTTIGRVISDLINSIITAVKNLADKVISFVKNLIENVVSLVSSIVSKITSIIKNLVSSIVSFISDLSSKISSIVSKISTTVVNLATSMVNKVKDVIKGFIDIGKNIITGIWDGISSGWDWLMDKIGGLGNAILDKVKDILGIHSPSKEFAKIGGYCVAGFNDGMEDLIDGDGLTKNINASLGSVKANISGGLNTGSSSNVNGVGGGFSQVVNINQKISTPDELARTLRLEGKYGLMRGAAIG